MTQDPPARRALADAEVTQYSISDKQVGEIRELEELLAANPESVEVREWLAYRFYTVGRFAESVHAYLELISRGHRAGVQYFHLGNAYYKMRQYQMALDAWKKTVELLPDDPKAAKARARILKVGDEHGVA